MGFAGGSIEDWWVIFVSGVFYDVCERVVGVWFYGFLLLLEWFYEAEFRGGEIGRVDFVRLVFSFCDFKGFYLLGSLVRFFNLEVGEWVLVILGCLGIFYLF